MSDPKKIYWDSSCFLCFLNPDETERRLICEDVLKHADIGEVQIWISTWVIVEVIRPKKAGNAPLPAWAAKAIAAVPEAEKPLEELWQRFQRQSPSQKLTPAQIVQIQDMFEWPYLKKIYVDQRVAEKAVELSRDYNLKPGDSVHAASAILAKCDVLQRWDKDFNKVAHLIPVEDPQRISAQQSLITKEFIAEKGNLEGAKAEHPQLSIAAPENPAEFRANDSSGSGNPAGAEENSKNKTSPTD